MLEAPEALVLPGSWATAEHYYSGVPEARLHPTVATFLRLGNARIAERWARLHPRADRDAVAGLLRRSPRFFRWSGADLLHTVDLDGTRRMVLIETNSSPSGNKSMPFLDPAGEQSGYRRLIEDVFLPTLMRQDLPPGGLAVLYDKNEIEARAYAAVLADVVQEPVHLVFVPAEGGAIRSVDGVLHVRHAGGWLPIRAALRYVTQRPWVHLPVLTRTAVLNPVLACLAGGRNKALAAKAYERFNRRTATSGLRIAFPETIVDLAWADVPAAVRALGGAAVVKVPYANAGQGIVPITCPEELDAFRAGPRHYDRWVVQALVGGVGWSSQARRGPLHHVGTVPGADGATFACDLRVMIGATPAGFTPVALYARRARRPLTRERPFAGTSWDVLGTNLSVREGDNAWSSDVDRLMMADDVAFDTLGLGLDTLIEAYVQTVMATLAIDAVAEDLVDSGAQLRRRRFARLVPDRVLQGELLR